MANSLYPGFIKLTYSFSGITHTQTLPVREGGLVPPGTEPMFDVNSGVDLSMSQCMTNYMAVMRPLFGSGTDFLTAEYWRMSSPTADPVWIYTHPLGVAGSHATQSAAMLQMVVSFRTSAGGILKLYLMEHTSAQAVNGRDAYPFSPGIVTNLANFVVGANGFIIGRDGGYAVVPAFYTTKFNDALRKRRMLLT